MTYQLYNTIVCKDSLGANKHLQGNDDIHKRLVISKQIKLHKKK
jgi:hypothetical protein